jgi:hypothetical protein
MYGWHYLRGVPALVYSGLPNARAGRGAGEERSEA